MAGEGRDSGAALLLKHFLFCIFMPVVVMVTVVAAMLVTTNGDSFGYGEDICYLDSALLVGELVHEA